jgi:hypothetical protein
MVSRAQVPDSVTINLNPWKGSSIAGTAALTARGDKTVVELQISGERPGDHPNHIHLGACADPDPNPTYPLKDVVLSQADASGRSVTTVDVPLRELWDGEFLILIHKSLEELDTYIACGDITLKNAVVSMPSSGAGTATLSNGGSMLSSAATLFVLAGVTALAAIATAIHSSHRWCIVETGKAHVKRIRFWNA